MYSLISSSEGKLLTKGTTGMTLDDWPGQAEYQAVQEARYARWRELRRQGLSYRRIAALDGRVSHARVQQVLSAGQELITITEAARRLQVDRRTVYIRLGSGSLKSRKVDGKQMIVWMRGEAAK